MFEFEDLAGRKFNRLLALRYVGSDQHRVSLWLFRCDCGAEVVVRGSFVKHGRTKSCGCYHKEIATRQIRKLWRSGEANWNYRHGRRCQ